MYREHPIPKKCENIPNIIMNFLRDIYNSKNLVLQLAKRDYRQQNEGSGLGIFWNYLQPLVFIGVIYIIIKTGFRNVTKTPLPFDLYLITGIVCWQYFASNIISMASVIRSYSFLVKKVDFRLSILPLVKILSSFAPHVVLTFLAILLAAYRGWLPSLYLFQLIYYFICMVVFLLGFGWFTSSTSLFLKDVTNIVSLAVQFGFWITPIFWHLESMPENMQFILSLNPACYIVTGYRDSIFSQGWFWQRPEETLIFWISTTVTLLLGVYVFRKLNPHFSEVV